MHYSDNRRIGASGRLFALGCGLFLAIGLAHAAPLRVVTTMSTFADLAETVGGENVRVSYVAAPTFNPHFIEPRPSDVLKVKRADLFIHGGLDLEAWRGPLVDAAGNRHVRPGGDRELPVSAGIRLLNTPESLSRAAGDIHIYGNPHFWVDPRNGLRVAKTIAAKLAEIDPANAPSYQQRYDAFAAELQERISVWSERLRPYAGSELVAYHDEWPYLLEFAGLHADVFLEPKPGIPPTPKHLLVVERHIRDHAIPAIIQATFMPDRPAKRLSEKTGVRVVSLCQNVDEVPEADSYISLVEYNVSQLIRAFADANKGSE